MKEAKVKSISLGVSKLINNSNDQFKNCSVSESLLFMTKALNSDFLTAIRKLSFYLTKEEELLKLISA